MRRGLPVMSQVLHFLDFSVTPKQLRTWREEGIRDRYNSQFAPDLNYQAPMFLDSGGFKLLWNETLDLADYDLSIKQGQGPKKILKLQQDLGGDIIATLDYPLPPGLSHLEAKARMGKSRDNAVAAAALLQAKSDYRPLLHVAAHGQDRDGITHYVTSVLRTLGKKGLDDYPFGLAVGSLVPLRIASNHVAVVNIIMGLREGMEEVPARRRAAVPIHAFGVSGTLIPLLAYLGVDSFDSSTYVQKGRNLSYVDPETYRDQRVLELDELTCDCCVCRGIHLPDMHHALLSQVSNKPQKCGHYKSKYYGDICLHNLEMDFRIMEQTREAIAADEIQELLVKHVERFPVLQQATQAVAVQDASLRRRLTRATFFLSQQPAHSSIRPAPARTISLNHRPDDFDITANGYHPPLTKSVLLIIPCSESKPYGDSRTHRYLMKKLTDALGEHICEVHKVTLSGLYGPVPEEREHDDPILSYDFRLDAAHTEQIALVARRLATYIRRHEGQYQLCLGYATSLAYRLALEATVLLLRQEAPQNGTESSLFQVLPTKPKARRLTEFFRHENIEQLVKALAVLASHTGAADNK